MISTRTLSTLPSTIVLKGICKSIALLDAIMEPDWEFRYYSYNSRWDTDQEVASMRDGSGNDYFILFELHGTIIKGYAKDTSFASYVKTFGKPYPGVLDEVPEEFAYFLSEPAFSIAETTFCIWQASTERNWHTGNIDYPPGINLDGSERLLFLLDGQPGTYKQWCQEYYERSIPLESIAKIYEHQPLSSSLIRSINPQATLKRLKEDITEIGYPQS